MSNLTDLRCFSTSPGKPTYVGTGKSIGRVCLQPAPADLLEKGVVVLPNADPGFEWLFSRQLAGIITMYGGANSHMAVRCAESGIPAAIGVGQHIYAKLAGAAVVQLDCAGQTIEIIR
jgi:phosphohistidine swiveling domain-containing protein